MLDIFLFQFWIGWIVCAQAVLFSYKLVSKIAETVHFVLRARFGVSQKSLEGGLCSWRIFRQIKVCQLIGERFRDKAGSKELAD